MVKKKTNKGKKYDKPVKIKMPFEEAMRRLVRVDKREIDKGDKPKSKGK